MRKSYTRYPFRVFSLILVAGFILSNFSLCSLIIINCETEEVSCCTTTCEASAPTANENQDGCCCKITEAPKQPAEIIPVAFDLSKKNISNSIHYYNSDSFDNANHKLAIFKNFSFHSPPEKDICILNSNFRI